MKRDNVGKPTRTLEEDSQQVVQLSLSKAAWQTLEQQSREAGVSCSELIEQWVSQREFNHSNISSSQSSQDEHCLDSAANRLKSPRSPEASTAERIATEPQTNQPLQAKIIELQQTVEEVRSQAQQLRHMADTLPHLIWICQPNGEVSYCNQQAPKAFGMPLAQLLAEGRHALIHPEDLQHSLEAWTTALQAGTPYQVECRLRMAGGSYRWYLDQGWPHLDELGNITHWLCICTDVGDRKQIEGQLHESQQFIQQIADATPGMLYIYDLVEQRNIYVNRQIGEVLGYSAEEIQTLGNQLFPELMHPDDLATLPAHLARFERAQVGDVIEREYRMRHANGEWRWLWSRDLVFSHTEAGLPYQVVGISHDITHRKQAEMSLRKTEERLSLVLQATNDAIYDRNLKTGSIWWNQAYDQLFGERPPSTNTPGWWVERIHPADRARVVASFKTALAQKAERWTAEYRYLRADGEYADVVDRAYIVRDQTGEPERYLGAILNVTHLKQVEENLRQTEERLQLALFSARMVAWDINLQTGQVVCSANATELWSIQAGTVEDFFTIVHPEDQPRLRQALERVLTHQEYPVQEYRIFGPDRTLRWISSRGQVYLDSQGQAYRLAGVSVDISDLKQAEAALHTSQEHYRLLVETLPQLICLSDANGRTTYCNQSWINYTGLTLEETQNALRQNVFHPDDYPDILTSWQAAKHGAAYSLEFRLRRWDGVYRWHLGKGVPLRAENGTLIGWLGTTTDIDDHKQAEQRQRLLAQAAQTFAAANLDLQIVLDSITELISKLMDDVCVLSLCSEDGQWLNHASCYHADPEVCAFTQDLLIRHPRRADEGIGGQVMRTGEPLLMPVNSQTEFGTAIKPEFRAYLERFQVRSTLLVPLKVQGQAIGVLSLTRHHPADPHTQDDLTLVQDLADRAAMAIANARLYQQAEQARQQAERDRDRTARLQAVTAALSESLTPIQVAEVVSSHTREVLKAASVLVALVTPAGDELEIIHYLGDADPSRQEWQQFPLSLATPLTDAVLTGQPLWEESLEERLARYPHLASVYAHSQYSVWISLPLVVEGRSIGGMTLAFAQAPQLTPEDRALMLSLAQQCGQAIARAQLYKAEQQARAKAVQEAELSAAANSTKDEFLAVLSHELRTPMNPILGWTNLLQRGKLDADRTAIALETIQRNAELQVQLIEDLLDISRILQGKLSLSACPVEPAAILNAAIETVRLAAEAKALQLHTHINADTGHVLGDATRLQQVFWNLLANAVKFTPNGGKINIHLTCIDAHAEIQVSDTGQGIRPDFLPYVFDTFRQADSSTTRTFGGLGLGLAITRHIVELHGGTLWAESPGLGQGSTFTVRLPLVPTPTLPDQETVLSYELPSLQGIQVLAVDDEIDNLELASFVLQQAGASVIAASSAAEALQSLGQNQPDILIADIGMPQTDGYALIEQVRALPAEQGGNIPAIALTAYAGEAHQQQALTAGFQRHLAKPIAPEDLLQAIASLLNL